MRVLPVLAKITFAAFIVSLAVGLVASFGTRLGFWGAGFGLGTLFPWCIYAGFFAFALGLVWMLSAMIANDSSGARYGLIGLIGAVLVLATPVYDYTSNLGLPPIHDISSDTERAPVFVALLTRRDNATNSPDYDGPKKLSFMGKVSTVSALQHKYYGEIHSISLLMSPEKLFKRAVTGAYGMGWNVIAVVPDEGRIEATDTTFFFGFTDDIVIRVKPAGMGAKLDIRSKARIGDDDEGRNAARVKAYIKRVLRM
jgi:hypothetical protein